MNNNLPLLFVRYASGSAGRFVSVMLQTSGRVACWDPELESLKGTDKFAAAFFEYIRQGYQSDLTRHLYNEPTPKYPVWPWFSATWPRGDDLTVDEFVDQLIHHEYQYWLENIQAKKLNLLLLHKSRIPAFALGCKVLNIVIDPAAQKWLNRARYVKIFGEENGQWYSREHLPDLLQKRYAGVERMVDLPDIWLAGSRYQIIKNHVINDPRVKMFADINKIVIDRTNLLCDQFTINLSDVLNKQRFVKQLSTIFWGFDLGEPDVDLISRAWQHYYETNIAIFKHPQIHAVATAGQL